MFAAQLLYFLFITTSALQKQSLWVTQWQQNEMSIVEFKSHFKVSFCLGSKCITYVAAES